MDMDKIILDSLTESIQVKKKLLSPDIMKEIQQAGEIIIQQLDHGGKLIVLGNGGSAADAQHISAEMVGRFETDHTPIPSIALGTNISTLTAVSNDFGFDQVFYRQMIALLNKDDVILAISTSGNSSNIIKAIEYAKIKGNPVVGLSGRDGGKMKQICHVCITVPCSRTARIQESHITIGHILCEIVEKFWTTRKKMQGQ